MLLNQKCRWNQQRDLLAILDCLKSCTHGNFSLSIANIARQQTVHGHRFFHIRLDLIDGHQLIGSLNVGEGIFQLALPGCIWAEGMAFRRLADGVQADELLRDFLNGFARLPSQHRPSWSVQADQTRCISRSDPSYLWG